MKRINRLRQLYVDVGGNIDKTAFGSVIHGSETFDTLVMTRVKILILQEVQDGPLRHVIELGKGSGTGSAILCNVSKNHVISHRCTYSAGRIQFEIRYLQFSLFT